MDTILSRGPLLRQAVGDRLPDEVLRYRKWGFGVPWTRYMQREPEFRELVGSLHTVTPIVDGPFDRRALRTIAADFLAGGTRFEAHVRRLVMIAVWHQACLDGAADQIGSRRTMNTLNAGPVTGGAVAEPPITVGPAMPASGSEIVPPL